MSKVGEIERATQNRIVKLFREQLGYQYLGDWEYRANNSNIEEDLVREYLIGKVGYPEELVNQQPEFIQSFFTTIQLVMAGKDTEGLRYGTIGTPEKFFLNWKEDVENNSQLQLDKYLAKVCNKHRLLEIIYNFVLFDAGVKKLPRYHQYFGIKAAKDQIAFAFGSIWKMNLIIL